MIKTEYPIKFKAAILEELKKPLIIKEVIFRGPLQPGQVLVKIWYSGICGKQIEEIEGTRPDPYIPHMLGHEGGGIVKDVGPGVKKLSLGDSVVLHWLKSKGIESATPEYTRTDGRKINAGWVTTFNEYAVVSENRLTKIPHGSNLEVACLLGCCITTGAGVILNTAKPLPLESVAVFGCGGVGLNSLQAAKLVHAYPIIAVDRNEESLRLAKKFGASHLLNSEKCDVVKEIKKITNPYDKDLKDAKNFNLKEAGADYTIISLGDPKAIELAIESAAIPGKVYLIGVPPYSSKISINAFDAHASKTIFGSHGGECVPDRDIPKYFEMHYKGLFKFDELISSRVSFENINQGIALTRSGKIGRCVVKF